MRVFDYGKNTRLLVFYHVLLMIPRICMSKSVGDEDLDTFTRNCDQKVIEKYQPIRWPRMDILQIKKFLHFL